MYIICTTEEMYVPAVHKIFPSFLINVLLFPERLDGIMFNFTCRFCIYIQCGLNIRMSHDFLDCLDIRFLLAESCAECVPYVMTRKMGDDQRLALFFRRSQYLVIIIARIYSFDSTIDRPLMQHASVPVAKHKTAHAIHF